MANEKVFKDAAEDEDLGSESLYLGGINAPKSKDNEIATDDGSDPEPEQYDVM